ncbi:DUF5131 family protein [Streptomyces sp. NPDC058595]|uniref:DUF5131 family protein n=1 Tax=Streptomyces sp. NPDC058595 TaxID=3346550 RepID=UPI00364A5467
MDSGIEWTDLTWNPTTGCDQVSPGCDRCYALTLAKRLKAMGSAKYQRDGAPRTSGPGFALTTHEDTLYAPLRKRAGKKIFVNSMSDLFHQQVPDAFIARVFAVMALSPRHTYQVLTKRPARMRALLNSPAFRLACEEAEAEIMADEKAPIPRYKRNRWRTQWWSHFAKPLPNVWLGISAEDQKRADQRIPALKDTPAAVRFLSLEPLLGPLRLDLTGISWVIAGGESGPLHRPLDLNWAREIRDQCTAHGTPFLFKQVGGLTPKSGGRLLDGRTWDGYPASPAPVR